MLVGIIGAGLAGLTAAHAALDAGADVVVFERDADPGGTTALSSGWVWRYRDMATFRWAAPHGDKAVQEAVHEELLPGLVWLEQAGVQFRARGTQNPRTEGVRIDPQQAVARLASTLPAGSLLVERHVTAVERRDGGGLVVRWTGPRDVPGATPVDSLVCAGGGYAADLARLAREAGASPQASTYWTRRNAGLSDGTAQQAVAGLGARTTPATGAFYGRAMSVGVPLWPDDYVRFSQVYSQHALVVDDAGRPVERPAHDWANAQVVLAFARRTGRAWYILDREAMLQQTPYGSVMSAVRTAREAGALVLEAPAGQLQHQLAERGVETDMRRLPLLGTATCAVAVRPGVTHTTTGLRIGSDARVVTGGWRRGPAVFAAGVDAGGIADGGYASGLAQALALGRIAGRSAAAAG